MKKPSLIERLTGLSEHEEFDSFFDETTDEHTAPDEHRTSQPQHTHHAAPAPLWDEETAPGSEELPVDMYQTGNFIVLKALVAGVVPGNIDVVLTRDMVTIKGTREEEQEVNEDGYFRRELYWGAFSRTILLPEEVDVDAAEATEKHGVLVLRLPKVNKTKETKVKVKSR